MQESKIDVVTLDSIDSKQTSSKYSCWNILLIINVIVFIVELFLVFFTFTHFMIILLLMTNLFSIILLFIQRHFVFTKTNVVSIRTSSPMSPVPPGPPISPLGTLSITSTDENQAFLAFVSHELRSPLHAILNMTQFLSDTPSPMTREQQEYIQTIRKTSDLMSRLVNDILDLSKLESGRFDLDFTTFDLHDFLNDVKRSNMPLFQNRPIELSFKVIEEGLPPKGHLVYGDDLRLHQILNNLLSNAAKFTRQGQVTVNVRGHMTRMTRTFSAMTPAFPNKEKERERMSERASLSPKQQPPQKDEAIPNPTTPSLMALPGQVTLPRNISLPPSAVTRHKLRDSKESVKSLTPPDTQLFLQIKITDTGIGMTEEDLKLLFIPYSQAKSRLLKHSGGTGLGLSIVKHLVEMMHGHISVESKVGVGTTVIFDVLLYCLHESIDERSKSLKAGASKSERRLTPQTLLTRHKQTASLHVPVNIFNTKQSSMHPEEKSLEYIPSSPKSCASAPIQTTVSPSIILIVDDTEINRKIASRILTRAGHHVECVNDGVEAVEAVDKKSDSIAMILMDLSMPQMSGQEATRIIRQRGYKKPIVALTASAIDGVKKECLEAGMNDVLSKPIDKKKLLKSIEVQLSSCASKKN